jgi:mRNA interferase MazF
MKRGTIVLTFFPFTDLSSSKRRPAIIVSRIIPDIDDVIVAYISSKIPERLFDTDLVVNKQNKSFSKTGLIKESVFKMDKLVTINKNIITGELGYADKNLMNELDKRLKLALFL